MSKQFTFQRQATTKVTQLSNKQWELPGCTDHQISVMSSLLNSDASICTLTGSGGVGKTHTISAFISYCVRNNISVALTGTTHAAVAVLSNMIPDNYRSTLTASTIHSYLGMKLTHVPGGTDKLVRTPKYKPAPAVQYLLVEESSMLTAELLVYVKQSRVTCKVILIGDAIQLNLPGAANLSRIPSFELTVNMRQDESRSDLRDYLLSLRSLIESNSKKLPVLPESSANITTHSDHCTFLKAYKESAHTSKVFACFMNKTVKSYNTNVKKSIVGSDDLYSIGDIIYPTSPSIQGKHIIPNRTICVITNIMDCDEFYSLQTDRGVLDVPKGKSAFNAHLQALADERSWKEFYSTKERFVHVHHLYAGTSHSLQGSTVDEVFVDVSDLLMLRTTSGINQYLRALYVAISRASKSVHLYTGSERKYKCLGDYTPRLTKEQS